MFEGFGRAVETFTGQLVDMEALVKMITGTEHFNLPWEKFLSFCFIKEMTSRHFLVLQALQTSGLAFPKLFFKDLSVFN